ncbi:MAG: hypothetical protein ABSA76_09885, partial [Bacteroidales bacterium]
FDKGKILFGLSTSSNNLYSMYSGGSSNFFHFGFTTIKTKSDNYSSSEKIRTFNFSPRVGYFIIKNLAAGLDINYSLISMGTGTNKETNSLFGIGPFIRLYLPQKKVAPFAEVAGSFGTSGDKTNSNNYKSSLSSFFGGIGLAVPIGDKFAFDLMAGYVSTTLKPKQNNTNNERDILGTLGIKVGFHLYIGANQTAPVNK